MRIVRILILFGSFLGLLMAQAHSDSGDLQGLITDAGGGAVPGAKVTLSDPTKGSSRSVQSNESGQYRFTLLSPGAYKMRVEAEGFTTRNYDGLEIRVGETHNLNAAMEVGAVNTEVNVTADVPVVDTARTQQASTIDSRRIESLPINRRNYLDLALQTPGVTETNDLVDGKDFRVVQSPQSGLSFGGGNGRGNGFFIDGGENYINSGGVRPSVSQEAVREFQVNRNSFGAEFGNATGGTINIITKSGTNDIHGDFFGFLRDRAIQARNFFDPGKSAFTRTQYGATLGAPIQKDKTFVFLAFEGLNRHETTFVPILQDKTPFYSLTPSQKALTDFLLTIPSDQIQQSTQQLITALTPASNPATLELFEKNSGSFPFSESNYQGSFRLDHTFSDKDLGFFRGNYTSGYSADSQFGALVAYNRGRSLGITDGTLMVGNTYIFSPKLVSETRMLFGYSAFKVHPTDPNGPEIDIEGYGYFGREIYLPSNTFERHYQVLQSFNYSTGRHNIKFGGDINPVRDTVVSETFFSGRFDFGPGVPLSALIDQASGAGSSQQLATLLTVFGRSDLVPALSDSINSLQAYSLGVPLYYQQGFGDPNWIGFTKRYNFYVQDTFQYSPHLTINAGLRYELEVNPSPVPTQGKNFAPRIGFAWQPTGDGKTVIRGGFGIYFARIDAQVANLPTTLNGVQIAQAFVTAQGTPGINNPLTGNTLTSVDIYGTLNSQGVIGNRPITLNDISQFGLYPGPNSNNKVIFGIDKNFRSPYAEQASFEIERAFGDLALSAGYAFNRGLHEVRSLDRNLYYTGRTADNQPTFGFKDPTILQYNVLESTANSYYNAMTIQAVKPFSHHFTMNAHYTWSKAIDELTDFNSDFQPHDQLNAKADKARSAFDQRHRFVFNSVIDTGIHSSGSSFMDKILGDWTVSPITILASGRPFNLLAGFDDLGDNHPTTHRPLNVGRNVGTGPAFYTFDLRLSRTFPLSRDGRRGLEFTAEGFNMLNHTNFKNINNTVGTADITQVPYPYVGHTGSPTDPLAFTSAYDARQFQFGLKVIY